MKLEGIYFSLIYIFNLCLLTLLTVKVFKSKDSQSTEICISKPHTIYFKNY